MELFKSEVIESNRQVLGTVAELVGKGGKIKFNESNLLGEGKALMIDLVRADGKVQRVFCSVAVSNKFRAKEITKEHILNFPITAATTQKDGAEIARVELPMGATIEVSVDGIKAVPYAPQALNKELLEALVG